MEYNRVTFTHKSVRQNHSVVTHKKSNVKLWVRGLESAQGHLDTLWRRSNSESKKLMMSRDTLNWMGQFG